MFRVCILVVLSFGLLPVNSTHAERQGNSCSYAMTAAFSACTSLSFYKYKSFERDLLRCVSTNLETLGIFLGQDYTFSGKKFFCNDLNQDLAKEFRFEKMETKEKFEGHKYYHCDDLANKLDLKAPEPGKALRLHEPRIKCLSSDARDKETVLMDFLGTSFCGVPIFLDPSPDFNAHLKRQMKKEGHDNGAAYYIPSSKSITLLSNAYSIWSSERLRFVIAHECGHHVLGRSEFLANCYAEAWTKGWDPLKKCFPFGDQCTIQSWKQTKSHIPKKCKVLKEWKKFKNAAPSDCDGQLKHAETYCRKQNLSPRGGKSLNLSGMGLVRCITDIMAFGFNKEYIHDYTFTYPEGFGCVYSFD